MKVERSNAVVHLTISDIMQSHRLDPIRVTLDDIEPGRGRITVECYGRAWASYWAPWESRESPSSSPAAITTT